MTTQLCPQILPLPLAYVNNGDQQFWKEKFHAANGKASACTHKRSVFFFLKGGGREFFFPLFPKGSQVRSPTCSQ